MSLKAAAKQVRDLLYEPPRSTRVHGLVIVAIDGRSGAGKTSLTRAVQAVEPDISVLSIENFYPGWDGLAAGPEGLVTQVLQPWRSGQPGRARYWDWNTMKWEDDEREVPLPLSGRVIIEGCASAAQIIEPFLAGVVWLEADAATRQRRAIARDGATFEPHWESWAAQEDTYLAEQTPRERADLTLHL